VVRGGPSVPFSLGLGPLSAIPLKDIHLVELQSTLVPRAGIGDLP
jgi:hypothetical protein